MKYKIGDKVRLLGTKDGNRFGTFKDYVIDKGFNKGSIMTIGHIRREHQLTKYFFSELNKQGCFVEEDFVLAQDFKNTKIRVTPETSAMVQRRLNELRGFTWGSGKIEQFCDMPYLYIGNKYFSYGTGEIYFKGNGDREITLKDLGLLPETNFKHLTKEYKQRIEVNKMELKNIDVKNLKEATKQFKEELMNAEVKYAKEQLRRATDRKLEIDRKEKGFKEDIKQCRKEWKEDFKELVTLIK